MAQDASTAAAQPIVAARPVAAHGRIERSAFVPHPLIRNRHLQTIVPSQFRPTPRLVLAHERLELPDGDFVDLGWCGEGSGSIVVLLHGMGGSFDSKYARGVARRLAVGGWRCVFMQFRGAGPEPNRRPRGYHSGDTGDFRHLLHELRRREPETKLYAAGWSLGGNVLLKALGEDGDGSPLAGAVAVSVPFLLRECALALRRGTARLYQAHLLRELKSSLALKFARMPCPVDLKRVLAARDFFEFDDAATAPLNGFAGAEDYYARASSRPFLARIRRPTLAIHALDDPFMTPAVVPDAAELAPQVTLELSPRGGHVGFVAADRMGLPRLWLERRIPAFLRGLADGAGNSTTTVS